MLKLIAEPRHCPAGPELGARLLASASWNRQISRMLSFELQQLWSALRPGNTPLQWCLLLVAPRSSYLFLGRGRQLLTTLHLRRIPAAGFTPRVGLIWGVPAPAAERPVPPGIHCLRISGGHLITLQGQGHLPSCHRHSRLCQCGRCATRVGHRHRLR